MDNSYNHTLLIFISLFLSASITLSNGHLSETLPEPLTRMEKTTRLRFYFQEAVNDKNPTVVNIIGNRIGFGTTFVIDDALTEGPERSSRVIGRAEGMYTVATQNDVALLMIVTFAFTEGKYNGSSISMLGRNYVSDDVRGMPIVGGSGLFRFATGYGLVHTVWFDPKTGDASAQYNVTVRHF